MFKATWGSGVEPAPSFVTLFGRFCPRDETGKAASTKVNARSCGTPGLFVTFWSQKVKKYFGKHLILFCLKKNEKKKIK